MHWPSISTRRSGTPRAGARVALVAAAVVGLAAGCSSSDPSEPSTPASMTTTTTAVTTAPGSQTRPSTTRAPNTDDDSGGANGYTPNNQDTRNDAEPLAGS